MISFPHFIAAAINLTFLQSVLQMVHAQYVEFVTPGKLADALQTHGGNSIFVFSLAIVYIRAGATRTFPQRLTELVYDAVLKQAEGTQEILAALNQAFSTDKKSLAMSLWGLCESASPDDFKPFLTAIISSPLILSNWLHLAVRGEKQVVKELFQILARIAQQNMKPNAKLEYRNVIQALLENQTYFLFHESNGVLAVIMDKGFVGNLINLFEVQWNFTFDQFDQLSLFQKFLQKRPIDASLLLRPDYMSVECSRFLIETVMNLNDLLDDSGRLTVKNLLLPLNFARISDYVRLSDHRHLEMILVRDPTLFEQTVIPGKYLIHDIIYFFRNLHLRGNSPLFSCMLNALKTYGNELSSHDMKKIQKFVTPKFNNPDEYGTAIFAAFMCFDRQEEIPCLKNYIMLLRAILDRNGANTLQVEVLLQPNLQEIICALRSVLPDFLLNALILFLNGISLLPVVNVEPVSQHVIAFLQIHAQAGSFPCMLQLMMVSHDLNSFIDATTTAMTFIGVQVDRDGPNDAQYQLNLVEMFNILHAWFCKFDIKMLIFNNRLSSLFTNRIILDAFVADQRFAELTRGLRNDRRIAQMRQECKAYCAQHGTTMAEAQKVLGIVVFDCIVCTSLSIPDFTSVFECGHSCCTGCAEQIKRNCPNCRAEISRQIQANLLKIRFRPDPAPQACSEASAVEPPEKRQRL